MTKFQLLQCTATSIICLEYCNNINTYNLISARIDAFESMRIVSVASNGANHNLAINDKNCLYAWGDNRHSQLGIHDQNPKPFYRIPR